MLEATDPDAIVDMSRKVEIHMPSDRPGMIMRKHLLALLKQHGEAESRDEALLERKASALPTFVYGSTLSRSLSW